MTGKTNLTRSHEQEFLKDVNHAEYLIKQIIVKGTLNMSPLSAIRKEIDRIISECDSALPKGIIDRQSYIDGLKESAEAMLKASYKPMERYFRKAVSAFIYAGIAASALSSPAKAMGYINGLTENQKDRLDGRIDSGITDIRPISDIDFDDITGKDKKPLTGGHITAEVIGGGKVTTIDKPIGGGTIITQHPLDTSKPTDKPTTGFIPTDKPDVKPDFIPTDKPDVKPDGKPNKPEKPQKPTGGRDLWGEAKGYPNVSDYEKKLKEYIGGASKFDFAPSSPGKRRITIWQKAELDIRHQAQLEMLEDMRNQGVRYAWTSSHPDCSERCERWQGKLFDISSDSDRFLMGTLDGIEVYSLKKVMSQKDRYGYENNIINGFNCRHYLIPYEKGITPVTDYSKEEVERERMNNSELRSYERRIRLLKHKAGLMAQVDPKESKRLMAEARKLTKEYKEFAERNGYAWFPYRI